MFSCKLRHIIYTLAWKRKVVSSNRRITHVEIWTSYEHDSRRFCTGLWRLSTFRIFMDNCSTILLLLLLCCCCCFGGQFCPFKKIIRSMCMPGIHFCLDVILVIWFALWTWNYFCCCWYSASCALEIYYCWKKKELRDKNGRAIMFWAANGSSSFSQLQNQKSEITFRATLPTSDRHFWPTSRGKARERKTGGNRTKPSQSIAAQVHWWPEMSAATKYGKLRSFEGWTQIIANSTSQHSTTRWANRKLVGM